MPAVPAPAAPNKFGLSDADALERIEGILTSVRITELALNPVVGKFDREHLTAVHRYIFQDVYEHAGQCRPAGQHAKMRGLSDGTTYRVDYANAPDIEDQIDRVLAGASARLPWLDMGDQQAVAQWTASADARCGHSRHHDFAMSTMPMALSTAGRPQARPPLDTMTPSRRSSLPEMW